MRDRHSRDREEVVMARDHGILLFIVFIIIAFSTGSFIGLGWGHAALIYELNEVRVSDNFVFRCKHGSRAHNYLEPIVKTGEWYHQHLEQAFQLHSVKPVHVYLFDSRSEVRKHTGHGIHAGLRSIYIES